MPSLLCVDTHIYTSTVLATTLLPSFFHIDLENAEQSLQSNINTQSEISNLNLHNKNPKQKCPQEHGGRVLRRLAKVMARLAREVLPLQEDPVRLPVAVRLAVHLEDRLDHPDLVVLEARLQR